MLRWFRRLKGMSEFMKGLIYDKGVFSPTRSADQKPKFLFEKTMDKEEVYLEESNVMPWSMPMV